MEGEGGITCFNNCINLEIGRQNNVIKEKQTNAAVIYIVNKSMVAPVGAAGEGGEAEDAERGEQEETAG